MRYVGGYSPVHTFGSEFSPYAVSAIQHDVAREVSQKGYELLPLTFVYALQAVSSVSRIQIDLSIGATVDRAEKAKPSLVNYSQQKMK